MIDRELKSRQIYANLWRTLEKQRWKLVENNTIDYYCLKQTNDSQIMEVKIKIEPKYLSCLRVNGERHSGSIGRYHGVGHFLIVSLKELHEEISTASNKVDSLNNLWAFELDRKVSSRNQN